MDLSRSQTKVFKRLLNLSEICSTYDQTRNRHRFPGRALREVRDATNNECHVCARRRDSEPAVSFGD